MNYNFLISSKAVIWVQKENVDMQALCSLKSWWLSKIVLCWVDKRRQEGSRSKWTGIIPLWWSWGGLKATTCAPCLTWNSLGQFHFKGFSSAEGGLNIWSPSLSSLASLAPLHLVPPIHTIPYSLVCLTFPPPPCHLSTPSWFLLPPPHCSSLRSSEPEEWGWQVHGWEERWGKGKKSN